MTTICIPDDLRDRLYYAKGRRSYAQFLSELLDIFEGSNNEPDGKVDGV